MDVICVLSATIGSAVGSLLGKIMVKCGTFDRWLNASQTLTSTAIGLATLVCVPLYLLPECEGPYALHTSVLTSHYAPLIKVFSTLLSMSVGAAMGWLLADVLQNCVRMDGGHTLGSTVGLAMVWLVTIFLHNYVIRMDICHIIGFTMGCTLAELGYKLFKRLYHGYKKHQPIQASLQVQAPNVRYPDLQARLHRLQAFIHGQHVDDSHQHSELHELCLETREQTQ